MHTWLKKRRQIGFTLVELLVVISIIALLVAILMPALSKARYQAQRVVCTTNQKSQHLAQTMYALDNDGKFPAHDGPRPNYYFSTPMYGDDTRIWTALHDTGYMPDSEVLICPVLVNLGEGFTTTEWFKEVDTWYGGWDWDQTPQSAGHNVEDILISGPYCWAANYRQRGGKDLQYLNAEESWPKNYEECKASRAFTFHLFWSAKDNYDTDEINVYSTADYTHGGSGDDGYGSLAQWSKAKAFDNPVGYSDGHVEIHLKSEMKPRAVETAWPDMAIYY